MIRVRDLRKIYPTRHRDNVVLDGISFDLAMGERLGVLGGNGAGKSTLVRLIGGAESPTSGTIERNMSVSWPMAFSGAFQAKLSGVDNVRFISRVYDQDFEKNLAFVEDFSELGDYLKEPVRNYSSGMRARLAFAVSMVIEFDCFLIDEIAAVGDARFRDRCDFELFEKRGDRAMVIVSHNSSYLRRHCNRWGLLHDGHLSLYNDFDVASDHYTRVMGLTATTQSPPVADRRRPVVLRAASRIAREDDLFKMHIERGKLGRERRDWSTAGQSYAAALSLHPYPPRPWLQYGHVMRAQGKFVLAEIYYRNACALGLPVDEVRRFLSKVFAKAGIREEQYPIRGLIGDSAALQPPSSPDVAILSRLFWSIDELEPEETLGLMRSHATLDELASAMIADGRFGSNDDRAQKASRKPEDAEMWLSRLCFLACPEIDYADDVQRREQIGTGAKVLERLVSLNGFSDWPKTQAALRVASLGSKGQTEEEGIGE